jgi:hypothetical protein
MEVSKHFFGYFGMVNESLNISHAQTPSPPSIFDLAFLCALATLREIFRVQTSPDEHTFSNI